LICTNFNFIPQVNQIKLGTFSVNSVGTGITDMVVGSDLTAYGHPDFNDGYVADCNLESQYPDDGMVTIELLPPPCDCAVSGWHDIAASATYPITSQYTSLPGVGCDNPPYYAWSDDCVFADINEETGLLTVGPTVVSESCIVCATDTANTNRDTGEPAVCCMDIFISGG
jgi:hypothetical protein